MNEHEKEFEVNDLNLDIEPLVGQISLDELLSELRFGKKSETVPALVLNF